MNRRFFIKNSGTALGLSMLPLSGIASVKSKKQNQEQNQYLSVFKDKVAASFYGIAIGEGMGAPVEGKSPKYLREKYPNISSFTEFIPGNNEISGKGYGRITDDTLLTEALIRTYIKAQKHLDAYDYEKYFLSEIAQTKVFIPEKQIEAPIIERLYYPDKYPWQKLTIHNSEPRTTGIGNMVNCGLAISIMPIGAVNAGNPEGAYQETVAFGLAHNESYGIEGGAVMAAAYAEAFKPNASIDSIIKTCIDLAEDGTKDAIVRVIESVSITDSMFDCIRKARRAYLPFSGLPVDKIETFIDDSSIDPKTNKNLFTPSRIGSIEELPVCLAMLKWGNGDFYKTITASVMYGNDNDCIAGMALGLLGALNGMKIIPEKLKKDSEIINKRDFTSIANQLSNTALEIYKKDLEIYNAKKQIFE